MSNTANGYYIVLISVHGLIRGDDLELGRDADTGGQTKYVVELTRALAERPEVDRIDFLTRKVVDPKVSSDYAKPIEQLSEKARIIRIECGEDRYIPKEELWDYLDTFSDNALTFLYGEKRLPSIIHSHYADAGYVGIRLSHQLAIPLIHTGHSLGRSKRKQLLASGVKRDEIETTYAMSRRIEAEESILGVASRVITSTRQEIEEQYGLYDCYQPDKMRIVPPGTDLEKFYPAEGNENLSNTALELQRFLDMPDKPIILALSRPDPKKNIITLIEAYGSSPLLQEAANLVIIAGNRDDIRDMEDGAQEILCNILLAIDQFDLYGKIAYPKHHRPDEVPLLYRLAALSKGVFINPALTEPFGLTLIEAAACGVPIIATENGGPIDIIGNCHNGHLIDPLNREAMADILLKTLIDLDRWKEFSDNGIRGVRRHYAWQAHAEKYLDIIRPLVEQTEPLHRMTLQRRSNLYRNQAIFTDLDQNLLGDREALTEFLELIRQHQKKIIFGIATGRRLDIALSALRQYKIPQPDVLISSLGTEIHYAPNLTKDMVWAKHINHLWNPRAVREILDELPGLKLQEKVHQGQYKISYYIDPTVAPDMHDIRHMLLQQDQTVNAIFSFGQYLDIVPVRASKGLALRWCAEQLSIPLENILTAGGSGADEDMMRGNTLAVIVANRHHEELSELTNIKRIYFSQKCYAAGIIEAMHHYSFFNIERTS